jgi:predicted TIM-barrel fold metal-dependent hydrolase
MLCFQAASAGVVKPSTQLIGPKVDHHQHLLSPEIASMSAEVTPVEVPEEMAELLRRRAAAWNDPAALAQLYAEQVMFTEYADQTLLAYDSSVRIGRKPVSDYVATQLFSNAYRITPVTYLESGSVRRIATVFVRPEPRGDASDFRYIASALYTVEMQPNGPWLITSEVVKLPGPPTYKPVDADALVKLLDEAGIERAVVLSCAYRFESRFLKTPNPAALRAENDWTAAQVARHPKRLVGFCGVNPVTDTALPEIERCSRQLGLTGVKLHFSNSGVVLGNAAHVKRLQQVFATANRLKLPIVAHIQGDKAETSRSDAEALLNQVLPHAPDIVVQIAHMAGSGPGWDDEALDVFAKAVEAKDPRTRNLYFDVATAADLQRTKRLALLAKQIRQIGPARILFASDSVFGGGFTPYQEWGTFRGMVPLTDAEFAIIRDNVAPYLR